MKRNDVPASRRDAILVEMGAPETIPLSTKWGEGKHVADVRGRGARAVSVWVQVNGNASLFLILPSPHPLPASRSEGGHDDVVC